ncbi:MAG: energy transducer TonB [Cyanobacteria bacterium J06621_3]
MATPFLRPTSKQSLRKKASAKAREKASALSPTIVTVLLSVAAHGIFIAFGPRASFSFAALSEAAQLQDAEESIVPIVQLTPADRSRLPAFAQPRPSRTPLNSLSLPPGLPGLANTTPKLNLPQTRQIPSASTQTQRFRQNNPSTFRTSIPESNFRRSVIGRGRSAPRPAPPVELIAPPSAPTASESSGSTELPNLSGLSASNSGIQLDGQFQTQQGLPLPPGTRPEESTTPEPSADNLLDERLAAAQGTTSPGNSSPTPEPTDGTGSEPETVPFPEEPIQTASSQGNPRQLLSGYEYDATYVDDESAQRNLEAWLEASAESKSDLASSTEQITIDSNFKACLNNPPVEGLVGVIVNPDGSQDAATVLKSTGYDVLNRQALSAVEYKDFGQVEQSTQYQVAVEVEYEPSGCVEALPE